MKRLSGENLIPVAILLAGVVLSITVYSVRHSETISLVDGDISKMLPVDDTDHVAGNPDAAITIITYSDIDCTYCTQFHEVMDQVIADTGPSGDVRWVYRHLPVVDMYPYSGTHAKAAECAVALGGSDYFWRFISTLHAANATGQPFNPSGYPTLARTLGLSEEEFTTCASSSRFEYRVARDFDNALAIGAKGAPVTVVSAPGIEPITVSGFFPYENMRAVLDSVRAKLR